MAAGQRTRPLTESAAAPVRLLDPAPPEVQPATSPAPSRVLESLPVPPASARLEERQRRWFRIREVSIPWRGDPELGAPASAEKTSPDPKG
jgi:hypothetical protein